MIRSPLGACANLGEGSPWMIRRGRGQGKREVRPDFCWGRPLDRWRCAVGWGFFGGVYALTGPIGAFAWGTISVAIGLRKRAWTRLTLMLLAAAIALTPWTIRNYLVFGRWIPVKSNLAFELYLSQCLQPDGLMQSTAFRMHPINPNSDERQEYKALAEAAYLDRKWQQFRQA